MDEGLDEGGEADHADQLVSAQFCFICGTDKLTNSQRQ